jgi:hypothetical protein
MEEIYLMSSFVSKPTVKFFGGAMIALSIFVSACQPQPATNTTNTNTTNTTTNINSSNTSSNANAGTTSTSGGLTIETKEPDQYSATVTMKVEATGNKTMSLPALTADFARNGANQRVSFKIGSDTVTYLDRGDKRYVILPNRKQYAELDAQSTGFEVPKFMTPAQIINQVKRASGCENAGEESFGGRNAVKYRCAAAATTATQAGDVKSESFIYVDKETGLPLHSESSVSTSGNVGGENSIKFITEMSNLQTTVPADAFNEPTGMSKIDPQQVRSQVETILKAAAIFMQGMMQNNSSTSAPAASPSASQTPSQ